MKLFTLYSDGFTKTFRAMVTIVILWGVIVTGTIMVVNPFQIGLEMVLGNSMATEILYEGFELEFVGELIDAVVPLLISSSWIIFVAAFLVYLAGIFVTAGIFRVIYSIRKPFRKGLFLMGADRGFAGYLLISLISGLLILLLILLLICAPVIIGIAMGAKLPLLVNIAIAGGFSVVLPLPLIMAATDYARISLVADKWERPFSALKSGFEFVKNNLILVYVLMFPFLVLSLATSWLAYKSITADSTSSSISIILLLAAFPLSLLLKALMRVLRYSTSTALYESESY